MSALQSAPGQDRAIERAIKRLAEPDARLAPDPRQAGYGVFAGKDRRRRPFCRLSEGQTRNLIADGVVEAMQDGSGYRLTRAGVARAARLGARASERYLAQHGAVVDRPVMDDDGDERAVRGYEPFALRARLARLKSSRGASWLTPDEIDAAHRLGVDWEKGQIGLMRGLDLAAGPQSGNARGPGGGREGALAIGLDARRRVEEALAFLAPALRRVAVALVIEGRGLEEFERRQCWPPRSAKIALKLALAQLASRGGAERRSVVAHTLDHGDDAV